MLKVRLKLFCLKYYTRFVGSKFYRWMMQIEELSSPERAKDVEDRESEFAKNTLHAFEHKLGRVKEGFCSGQCEKKHNREQSFLAQQRAFLPGFQDLVVKVMEAKGVDVKDKIGIIMSYFGAFLDALPEEARMWAMTGMISLHYPKSKVQVVDMRNQTEEHRTLQ